MIRKEYFELVSGLFFFRLIPRTNEKKSMQLLLIYFRSVFGGYFGQRITKRRFTSQINVIFSENCLFYKNLHLNTILLLINIFFKMIEYAQITEVFSHQLSIFNNIYFPRLCNCFQIRYWWNVSKVSVVQADVQVCWKKERTVA